MSKTRCEEVIVQLVVRSYDDVGRPDGEMVTQPVKVFRNAKTHDFWAEVDKAVKQLRQAPDAPALKPPKAQGRKASKKR